MSVEYRNRRPPPGLRPRPRPKRFFVQSEPREPWHCESETDCTVMLCGVQIPLRGSVKVRHSWGVYRCLDCWMILQQQDSEDPPDDDDDEDDE